MVIRFADPFDALLDLQRALEERLESGWLQDFTTSRGPFPPINVFQQGDDILAIIELPGIDKNDLQIQAKENTIPFPAGSPLIIQAGLACIEGNASGANSTARCRCQFNSIQTASRPIIRRGFWRCFSPWLSATNREPSRLSDEPFR
jgi:hypothetical protein